MRATGFILLYTLYDEPLPQLVALMTVVYRVWLQVLNHISDRWNIEAPEESVKLVSSLKANEKNASGASTNLIRNAKNTLV